ncbi:SusC/RagA family TonB-linked outer membrane protein [Larkinella soli]|uniref:SusC/RagA family TonB-linked outer membrane protein n=1 Tax=Larkinella soli TaxID=1770527 RepID=UPI000FFB0EDF|nr:TonB-dependent receptor [Larkinella soli]
MKKRTLPAFFTEKRFFLLVALLCCCLSVIAQQARTVKGKITDERNEGLPGVSIVLKGTTTGTTTDAGGQYTLNVPSDQAVLVFSFLGYESQEITVGNQTLLNITLKGDSKTLNEVVVVGYGTQSREVLTTSVSKLDAKVLENVPYANAASALQGTIPGVRVQAPANGGQPGAAPRIIVRGGTSINNPNGASPLYIIDGIIRTNMNDINPDDIESLQVLKDAASTAIYGARGSNGVVIITTKTGKSGKTRVTYSYDFIFSQPGKLYEMANAREYIYLQRLGAVRSAKKDPTATRMLTLATGAGTGNDLTNNTIYTTQYLSPANQHKLNEGWESMPDPLDSSKTIIFQNTDYQRLIYRNGYSHNHYVALTGGTEKATFNAGVGYLQNQGTAITTRYDRLTFNLNGELKVRDNLTFFGRTMFTRSTNNEVYDIAQIFYRSAANVPTSKLYYEDGTLAPGANRGNGNAKYFLNKDKRGNSIENMTLSVGGRWDILPGLSFDPQVSLYKVTTDGYSFLPSYFNGTTAVTTRAASSNYSRLTQWQADAVFSYDKTFATFHNLSVKAGFSYFGRNNYTLTASGQGAATDLIPTLNAAATPVAVGGIISDQVILGYFGRINYDYKQKYLFSLNARYDGASNLGANHKWGFFPGVSVGWNLHQEEFWQGLPAGLIQLKLRGSYGVNGNISGLSDFQSQGEYGVGARYLGISAVQNTVIPNPSLKWEQSKTFNVGADLGLFKSRVNVIADVYRRVTDNLLTSLTLPPSTGFNSIFTNLGSLENRGVELELSAQILAPSSRLQWQIALNAAKTTHKILTLPYNGTPNNRIGGYNVYDPVSKTYVWGGGLQEGGRIGDHYAWKQIGVYATDEEAKSAPVDQLITYADKTKYGGDANFLDVDGNNIIDERDRVYVGNPFPVWTGGISNTLSYKNFTFTLRFDYATGHTIYNYARAFMDGQWAGVNLTKEMAEKSWKRQGDNASMVQYQPGIGNYSNWRGTAHHLTTTNSIYYETGDYLCVREVTLSYNIPSSVLQKLKISNLRFNLTGNNLHYFTNYKGLNPEDGDRDNGRYPIPKNIAFGASLTF